MNFSSYFSIFRFSFSIDNFFKISRYFFYRFFKITECHFYDSWLSCTDFWLVDSTHSLCHWRLHVKDHRSFDFSCFRCTWFEYCDFEVCLFNERIYFRASEHWWNSSEICDSCKLYCVQENQKCARAFWWNEQWCTILVCKYRNCVEWNWTQCSR